MRDTRRGAEVNPHEPDETKTWVGGRSSAIPVKRRAAGYVAAQCFSSLKDDKEAAVGRWGSGFGRIGIKPLQERRSEAVKMIVRGVHLLPYFSW